MLIVAETHPVQYHAPVWRECVRQGLPVHVVYGSDFSVVGAKDEGFGVPVKWDCDLLSGYSSTFLSTVAKGGAKSYLEAKTNGLNHAIAIQKGDALMVLGYSSSFDRSARVIGSALNLPLIMRAETTELTPRSFLRAAFRTLYLKSLYPKFSAFNPIGTHSRQHFQRMGVPDERMFDSPYCVDEAHFELSDAAHARYRTQSRLLFGATELDTVLIFSGKLMSIKAPEMILRAVNALSEPIKSRVLVVFLGEGVLREPLKLEAQNLGIRTHFLGFQNQSKLSSFYHGADLLVLPTRTSETWGLVVNEALLHGLPALVSDTVGSAVDLITPKTGAIFERGNQISLNHMLLNTLDRLAFFNRRDCIQHVANFSVKNAAAGVISAYQYLQSRS
jgi:glycosyltransferase involved in cell wall biosynthesis